MHRHRQWLEEEMETKTAQRQTGGLAGIAVALALVVGGLFLVQHLRQTALIEDCLMSGRSNCDVLLIKLN